MRFRSRILYGERSPYRNRSVGRYEPPGKTSITNWKSQSSILATLSKEFPVGHFRLLTPWIKRALEKPALTATYLAIHADTHFKDCNLQSYTEYLKIAEGRPIMWAREVGRLLVECGYQKIPDFDEPALSKANEWLVATEATKLTGTKSLGEAMVATAESLRSGGVDSLVSSQSASRTSKQVPPPPPAIKTNPDALLVGRGKTPDVVTGSNPQLSVVTQAGVVALGEEGKGEVTPRRTDTQERSRHRRKRRRRRYSPSPSS